MRNKKDEKFYHFKCPAITFGNIPIILKNLPDIHKRNDIRKVGAIVDPNIIETPVCKNLLSSIKKSCEVVSIFTEVHCEPFKHNIIYASEKFKSLDIDTIVSIGGGSTIDTAKGVALLKTNNLDIPEEFQPELPIQNKPIKHIAFPSTSGPGAEVSPAMIYRLPNKNKTAVISEKLIPTEAIIVPDLSCSLSRYNTAICAWDGIVHSIESLISTKATMLSDILASKAISLFFANLHLALQEPKNIRYRTELAEASFISSLGLRITGAGAIHAISSPLATALSLIHGISNILVLLQALEVILTHSLISIEKLTNALNIVSETNGNLILSKLEGHLKKTLPEFKIESIPSGDNKEQIIQWTTEAMRAKSLMQNSPYRLGSADVMKIYEDVLKTIRKRK